MKNERDEFRTEAEGGCAARQRLLPDDLFGLKSMLVSAVLPTRFMEPYDAERVEAANGLYRELLETSASDIEALRMIRRSAEERLCLTFDTEPLYGLLMRRFSPGRYMEPYDAEFFQEAHLLCAELTRRKGDICAMEELLIRYQTEVEARRRRMRSEADGRRNMSEGDEAEVQEAGWMGDGGTERVLVMVCMLLFAVLVGVILMSV